MFQLLIVFKNAIYGSTWDWGTVLSKQAIALSCECTDDGGGGRWEEQQQQQQAPECWSETTQSHDCVDTHTHRAAIEHKTVAVVAAGGGTHTVASGGI